MADKGENGLHQQAIGWGILACVFAALLYLVWMFFDTEIRDALRWWRYAEMWLVSLFVDHDYAVTYKGKDFGFLSGFNTLPNYKASALTQTHLSFYTILALEPYRIIVGLLMVAGAVWCWVRGPQTQYRNKLGLDELIERQSHTFPAIRPFVKFNPSSQPPRPPGAPVPAELPPFAEALGPEEWLAYHQNPMTNGHVDQEAAAKAFTKQLYGPWRGAMKLKPYQQILLAAFCLKAARKRDQSDTMLGRLASCWDIKHGLDLKRDRKLHKEALKILNDKKLSAGTLSKCNQHAFITTAMLRALLNARDEGGVLAPAQFVWLRAYDRTLWYPLNNLGRQSLHTEALGAMAHFKAERRTFRPIPVPKVQDAVNTITTYMESKEARPVPQLDYSKSKKRGVKKAT